MATWDLDQIHRLSETEVLLEKLNSMIKSFKVQKDKLDNVSPKEFHHLLQQKEEIAEIAHRLGARADLWLAENTSDQHRSAHHSRILQKITNADNELLFFKDWFRNISNAKAKQLIDGSGEYRYMLERWR